MSNKGYKHTKKARENMRKAHLGKYPSQKTREKMSKSRLGKPCSEETKKKISEANTGKKRTKEVRRKISEKAKINSKKLWQNPNYVKKFKEIRSGESYCKKQSEAKKRLWQNEDYRIMMIKSKNNPEVKEKMSKSAKEMWKSSEYIEKRKIISSDPKILQIKREASLKYWEDPKHIEEQRECTKNHWKNQEYASKVMKGLHKTPTSYERKMIKLLKKYDFPFIYNGDAKVCIDGLTPDFISTTNNYLIEVGDTFWHPQEYDKMRRERFTKKGFKSLFLYEDDIQVDDWETRCCIKIKKFLED